MNTFRTTIPLVATLCLAATGAYGFGGSIAVGMARLNDQQELDVSFSATATLESDEFNVQEQMYYRPGKLREEMQISGQDMVTIQRHDLGKFWMLMPQGFYMETGIGDPSEQTKSFRLVEHEELGSETVNGMETEKHHTVWETDDGTFSGTSWVTDDGIVVKAFLSSESRGEQHDMHFQITELNRGSQAESLFEVPDGYARMDLSGARGLGSLFGGEQGAQGRPEASAGTDAAAKKAEAEEKSAGRRISEGLRGLFKRD